MSSRRRRSGTLAAVALASVLTGCSNIPLLSGDATPHCPVALVPSQDLEEGLLMRQRLHFTTPESSLRVETAVEVREGKLVIAAFTPFGTRAFSITQVGTEVEIEGNLGRHLGVRPILVLDALHRAHLLPSPGTGSWQWHDEQVEEQWIEQRLVMRSFRPLDEDTGEKAGKELPDDAGAEGNEIGARVEYRESKDAEALHVDNRWCEYEARIVTLAKSRRPLGSSSP